MLIVNKSYFLFTKGTYKNIRNIYNMLIIIGNSKPDSDNYQKTLMYLLKIAEFDETPKLFPELKIYTY